MREPRLVKILVVTDVYPPHHIGGYELGCRDVVEGLRARGHKVEVLTSTFRTHEGAEPEDHVERVLQFNLRSDDPNHRKLAEIRIFRKAVARFQPEIIYFWNQRGLTMWLSVVAAWSGYKMAFFLSDADFVSWRVGAWLLRWAGRKNSLINAIFGKSRLVRGRPVVCNHPCHFASEFLRNVARRNAIAVAEHDSTVIHWGIDPSRFKASARMDRPPRRALYVGQMIPQKGVHTAIAAIGLLAKEASSAFTLTLVGGGLHPDYEKRLREMPSQLGIADRVNFLGKVPRSELASIYAKHDILIFPSEWDEPFAITPLEAMASGLVVVGTTTGGSGELFRNRETAMTFTAGQAGDCARAIRELCADQTLAETIRNRALGEVTTRYTLASMVDHIEASLQGILNGTPRHS